MVLLWKLEFVLRFCCALSESTLVRIEIMVCSLGFPFFISLRLLSAYKNHFVHSHASFRVFLKNSQRPSRPRPLVPVGQRLALVQTAYRNGSQSQYPHDD